MVACRNSVIFVNCFAGGVELAVGARGRNAARENEDDVYIR
jgi:hypothetical protein